MVRKQRYILVRTHVPIFILKTATAGEEFLGPALKELGVWLAAHSAREQHKVVAVTEPAGTSNPALRGGVGHVMARGAPWKGSPVDLAVCSGGGASLLEAAAQGKGWWAEVGTGGDSSLAGAEVLGGQGRKGDKRGWGWTTEVSMSGLGAWA